MQKILITGGAGFIGSHLADYYVEQGWEVLIYDNFCTGNREYCHPQAEVVEGDISDTKLLEQVMSDFRPTVVSHHAAHISVRNSFADPVFDADKNIIGSINVFRLAGEYDVEQVIFASTGGVMLEASHVDFPAPVQQGNLDLDSPYAISKFCAEKYLRYFSKKFQYTATILRYANIYGPRQTPKSEAGVIAIFLQRLLQQKSPQIYGDGNQTRDFLYIDDVVSGHSQAIEQRVGGTFNLSSAREVSVNQIYEKLVQALEVDISAQRGDYPFEELSRSCLDNQDFMTQTGWKPLVSFDEGIQKTIKWNQDYY